MVLKGATAAAILLLTCGGPAVAASNPFKKVMALTEAQAQAKTLIQEDSLSTVTIISTEAVGRNKGHIPMGEGDVYLQAGIDKKSGAVVYKVVGAVGYWGNWAFYNQVAYSTPGDPVAVSLEDVRRTVITCMSAAGCKYQEVASFSVPEDTLRAIAGSETPWRFRFSGSGGPAWAEAMSPVEVRAFLAAVDSKRPVGQ